MHEMRNEVKLFYKNRFCINNDFDDSKVNVISLDQYFMKSTVRYL